MAPCVKPHLDSAHATLTFQSFSGPGNGPPPVVRSSLLTNKTAAPLYFQLGVDTHGYSIVSAELGPGWLTMIGAAEILDGHTFMLPCGETVKVNVCYTPKRLPKKAAAEEGAEKKPLWRMREEQEAADKLVTDAEYPGNLVVAYSNGQVQEQPLLAKTIFPAVETIPATVDFGAQQQPPLSSP